MFGWLRIIGMSIMNLPVPYGKHGLRRKRIADMKGFIEGIQYEYTCECGTKLSEGPSGGMSINAVCKNCMINYGNLPGYYGDQS